MSEIIMLNTILFLKKYNPKISDKVVMKTLILDEYSSLFFQMSRCLFR